MDLHTKVNDDNVTGRVVGEAEKNKNILMSVKQVKKERERGKQAYTRSLWMIP